MKHTSTSGSLLFRSRILAVVGGMSLLASACVDAGSEPGDPEEEPVTEEATSELTAVGAWYYEAPSPAGQPANTGYAVARGRIDGNTRDDLVIGEPGGGGQIRVHLATIYGISTAATVLSQDSPGVPGVKQPDDRFGHALAIGDFNGDGYGDIAVGVPGDSAYTPVPFGTVHHPAAGGVNIFYGPTGAPARAPQLIQQQLGTALGPPEAGASCGSSVAAGNFNGDVSPTTGLPIDDLAIGCEDADTGGQSNSGNVLVVHGTSNGLNVAGSGNIPAGQKWNEDTPGIGDDPASEERFGAALAVGDFDADGKDDLAVGAPRDNPAGPVGAVHVIRGSAAGLTATNAQFIYQDGPFGISYSPGGASRFGGSLAAGQIDGEGGDDLVIGMPLYAAVASDNSLVWDAGGVMVVLSHAGSNGLSSEGFRFLSRRSLLVPGEPAHGEHCGTSVAVADMNGDGYGDIAFSCPLADITLAQSNHGAVFVNYGPSFETPSSPMGEMWTQASSGVGEIEAGSQFGHALCPFDRNFDTKADLVIGAPYSGNAGSVTVLNGN